MAGHFFVLMIVAIGMGGAVIIVGISIFAKAIGDRGIKRKELQELRRDISEIRNNIADIKEQLADIIIRMD